MQPAMSDDPDFHVLLARLRRERLLALLIWASLLLLALAVVFGAAFAA
jgi:hypothetical protein